LSLGLPCHDTGATGMIKYLVHRVADDLGDTAVIYVENVIFHYDPLCKGRAPDIEL
jgi:hypothetical protein